MATLSASDPAAASLLSTVAPVHLQAFLTFESKSRDAQYLVSLPLPLPEGSEVGYWSGFCDRDTNPCSSTASLSVHNFEQPLSALVPPPLFSQHCARLPVALFADCVTLLRSLCRWPHRHTRPDLLSLSSASLPTAHHDFRCPAGPSRPAGCQAPLGTRDTFRLITAMSLKISNHPAKPEQCSRARCHRRGVAPVAE